MSIACAVFPEEVDYFVESLRRFQVAEVGSRSWFEQHETVLKLTQQAYIEASTEQEEVIKERIIIEGKLPFLVHEIYCILIWRNKVLPKLLDVKVVESTFVLYSVLYYEVNVVALLETVLFHRACCEALGGCVLDLIDYCAQAVGLLIGLTSAEWLSGNAAIDTLNESTKEEIERLNHDMNFKIGLKCLTILSYLVDNLAVLPLSAVSRVFKVHDVPCLISEILHEKPWLRKRKGFEKFLEDQWTPVYGDDILKVTKTEAQVWFCLFGLLFNENGMREYEINQFRQREIGKCVGLLNEQILDQLPALVQLKQFLCTLQMGNSSSGNRHNNLLLEELPEIRETLTENANKYGWEQIILAHRKIFVDLSQEDVSTMAKRLSTAYNTDLLEMVANKSRKTPQTCCSTCRGLAEKKCSKCEAVFYCSRECQVADWPRHKDLCHQLKAL